MFHGNGQILTTKGSILFNGSFLFDSMNGKGQISLTDGSRYEGEIKNYIKEGKGILDFSEKDPQKRKRYKGEFKNGMMHGNGKLVFSDETEKKGMFLFDSFIK